MAILVTGATVTATRAPAAAAADTNTFTNVIQDITISLTVYSNAPYKSSTSQTGEKPVTVTTKSVIAALSNAQANIPSLVGFDWGKSPALVIDTTFTATNIVSNTVTVVASNTAALNTTNAQDLTFGTTVVTIGASGSATITNNEVGTNGGTNLLSVTTWTDDGATSVPTNAFTYTNAAGVSTNVVTFPTNVGVWTVITTETNASGTNLLTTTYTNVPHTTIGYITNKSNVEVQGGTAKDPVFADVSSYVSDPDGDGVIITATGTDLGTTNATYISGTTDSTKSFSLRVFNTTAGTAVGNNLDFTVYGFAKGTFNNDILLKSKTKGTNEVPEEAFTASVSGHGYIGGSFETNGAGTNSIGVPATEYYGTNMADTNIVSGFLTNAIPVVVEGTISLGSPKSVAQ